MALHKASPKPKCMNRHTEINICAISPIDYAAPPAVNVSVTTLSALIPQATFVHETKAAFTIPFACAIVTVEAAVAPANEVVKYSVNTFCDGQHGLPFFDTYVTVPCAFIVTYKSVPTRFVSSIEYTTLTDGCMDESTQYGLHNLSVRSAVNTWLVAVILCGITLIIVSPFF